MSKWADATPKEREDAPPGTFCGPGNSFPIADAEDIRRAIPRLNTTNHPTGPIIACIKRKARDIDGGMDALPEAWKRTDKGDRSAREPGLQLYLSEDGAALMACTYRFAEGGVVWDTPVVVHEIDEPRQFAVTGNLHKHMVQQMHDHTVAMGAECPVGSPAVPAPGDYRYTSETMGAAVAVQMTEDARLRSVPFVLPRSFGGADALPEWIPYLPAPHEFTHPVYGTVAITPERVANFVNQFNAGVYQDRIPLDGEHRTKESGALAWIRALRVNADGSADARVEWTPRGAQMYRDGAFRYISPEWYDEWTDPATGKAYRDIAIGGALTTRPFFKAPYLRPLAASEDGTGNRPDTAGERSQGMTATPETVSPAQFTELESKFTELVGKFEASEAARTAAEQENATLRQANESLAERVAAMERTARTQRLLAEAKRWGGDERANLARLEKLADRFGEDSDDFKEECRERRAFAEQRRMAQRTGVNLYEEVGSDHGNPDGASASAQLEALAKDRAAKSAGGKTYEQAFREVANERPDLALEAERETMIVR